MRENFLVSRARVTQTSVHKMHMDLALNHLGKRRHGCRDNDVINGLALACVACDRDPLVHMQERSRRDHPTIGSNEIVT